MEVGVWEKACAEDEDEVKAPRKRNMAEGLSLDNLDTCSLSRHNSFERNRNVHAKELEALTWPKKVHGGAVTLGKRG
jgi:hypothetical protein